MKKFHIVLAVGLGIVCLGQVAAQADLLALWRLDDGEDRYPVDVSGNGNTGYMSASALEDGSWNHQAEEYMPTWVTGKYGMALEFSPSFDVADKIRPKLFIESTGTSFENIGNLNLGESFTVMVWAWFNDDGTGNLDQPESATLIIKSDSYWISLPSASEPTTFRLDHDGGSTGIEETLEADSALPLEQWVHIAITYDFETTTLKLFIDGVENDSRTVSGATKFTISPWDIFVGHDGYSGEGGRVSALLLGQDGRLGVV